MCNRNFAKCRNGYSLVQMLVGLAIACIVTFGVLTALHSHRKATIAAQRNMEFQEITSTMNMYFSNSDACKKLFSNHKVLVPIENLNTPKVLSASSVTEINPLSYQGSNLATVGVVKNGIKPTSIGFTKVYKAFSNAVNNFYILDFTLAVEKIGDAYGSAQKEKSFQLYFKTNLNGEVQDCGLVNSSDEGKCILSGKIYDFSSLPFCK